MNGIQRRLTPKNIARNLDALWHLALSGPRADAILREVKPDLVIGAGGYVSGRWCRPRPAGASARPFTSRTLSPA
ncbi:MAG: hypothetical protein ACLSWY_08005 [Ruthenibacterium lactatiformans]